MTLQDLIEFAKGVDPAEIRLRVRYDAPNLDGITEWFEVAVGDVELLFRRGEHGAVMIMETE